MPYYYVEGLYITKAGRRRSVKSGRVSPNDISPFTRSIWASGPAEALKIAAEALDGGEWVEPPRVSQTSEEQRMRQMGAPELPGFGSTGKPAKKNKSRR
jgi:hypothetical protein